jgi:hypothetical protein
VSEVIESICCKRLPHLPTKGQEVDMKNTRPEKRKCCNCDFKKYCRDTPSSWFFFITGLIATLAIRLVTILMPFSPFAGRVAWYIGIIGFLFFFWHQYQSRRNRRELIARQNLAEKIHLKQQLEMEDYAALSLIMCALISKKEQINYFFIFIVSAVALAVAIALDLS